MTQQSARDTAEQSAFIDRHIGVYDADRKAMLSTVGFTDLDALTTQIVPKDIQDTEGLSALGGSRSEHTALSELRTMAAENTVLKSYIGLGYYGTYTPPVIARNVLENPGWYTAYTPYQPEISQGRLELLLYFQQMIIDLTGLPVANASLLDEATAAAEAIGLCRRANRKGTDCCIVDANTHPQTIDVIRTRMQPIGITVVVTDAIEDAIHTHNPCAVLLSYPGSDGVVSDIRALTSIAHEHDALVVCTTDLLACAVITAPGALGIDVAVGSSQRFGVPMGFGGPHAAFIAARENMRRLLPGRIIGVSKDAHGNKALRMALQTREQHIRRDKATSNICTAQALLAMLAVLYAIYHGPQGIRRIAERVHKRARLCAQLLDVSGLSVAHTHFFDTVRIDNVDADSLCEAATAQGCNIRRIDDSTVSISFDETTQEDDVHALIAVLTKRTRRNDTDTARAPSFALPEQLQRSVDYLTHPVFSRYHSETEMMRYLRRLEEKDIALNRAMIPLGSCTMKLNAAAEMIPIGWPEFADMHPFAPADQTHGYQRLVDDLAARLCVLTGFAACSLQPNSGAQGEFAGLLAIDAWHKSRGDAHRNICLIPRSAHGTNPASAVLAGMQVVVIPCDDDGNIDLVALANKAAEHAEHLAAIMVTYPSTHGVFEQGIRRICDIVHKHGGQVYLDGANLNAQLGLSKPGHFGADVCHINLHKTFSIPHGGGGPGVGPIGVAAHLAPYVPGHIFLSKDTGDTEPNGAVSAAPFGSAGILPISWMYIRMMGDVGLRLATQQAILSANYIAKRLCDVYPILYSGTAGLVAHECIIDLRPLKAHGVSEEDVAKRLIDYGFHAPTMSFPVAGTLMIEPTESESKAEIDRFIDAMRAIYDEVTAIAHGTIPYENSMLAHAPHTAQSLLADEWHMPYTRAQAAYPAHGLRINKYWPPVGRVDNVYGDRHLVCSCPSPDAYE